MTITEPLRGTDFLAAPDAPPDWLWEGFLVRGQVTLLTSAWKCGKSTLLAMLLRERQRSGALLGRAVEPGVTAVVSEEPADLWRRRARQLEFGRDLTLFCRPFTTPPSFVQWDALIDRLGQERKQSGVDLVVLDPLVSVLPCSENDPQQLSHALHALRRLTDLNLAVLILHHPSKAAVHRPGLAARGSGALPAFADVVLEMRPVSGNPGTRRRRLLGFSRHPETPSQLVVELDRAGTQYDLSWESGVEEDFMANWHVVAELLAQSETPPTRGELRARWPASLAAPHETTLWRWLNRALDLELVERTGEGGRYSPYRYRLAEEKAVEEASEA